MCQMPSISKVNILGVLDWSIWEHVPYYKNAKSNSYNDILCMIRNYRCKKSNSSDWHHNDFDLAADLNLDENELRNNITLMYMKLPKAVRARVGHQLGWDSIDWGVKGLLHSCSFLEEDCNNERQVGTKMRGFWSHELI